MPAGNRPLGPTVRGLVCAVAAFGFAFDIYELLMLPLIVRPALADLGGILPGTPEFSRWVGLLFFVPALCGGVFGLLVGLRVFAVAAVATHWLPEPGRELPK